MRMRLLTLLPLAGCNQIFGLDSVTLVDAAPDTINPDGPQPTVTLQIITPGLGALATPTRQPAYAPMVPAPRVEVGDIGGSLVEATYTADGTVILPYSFAGRSTPWRMVYTRSGFAPHEVQWAPTEGVGHFVELQLTPDDRAEIPASAVLSLRPDQAGGTPYTGTYTNPRVYTTGAWTETRMAMANPADTIKVALTGSGTVAIAGPKRAVSPEDYVILAEYAPTDGVNCQGTTAMAAFQLTVSAGEATDPDPPERTLAAAQTLAVSVAKNPTSVIASVNGVDPTLVFQRRMVAAGPAGGIPLLARTANGFVVPQPVGMTLLECNVPAAGSPDAGQFRVPGDPPLMLISATSYFVNRTIAGVSVNVGVGAVAAKAEDRVVAAHANTFDVVIPHSTKVDGIDTELATNATKITLPTSTNPIAELSFGVEPTTSSADFFTATLHRVENNALVRERDFTFSGSPLQFNRDLLVPGTTYVFEVRSLRGVALAGFGDFREWTDAQAVARTYTQAFGR